MTRDRKPSKKSVRPASKSAPRAGAAESSSRPTGNRSKADGKLHIQPGSFRKPKTDSRPKPASRRGPDDASAPEPSAQGGTRTGSGASARSSSGSAGRSFTGRTYARTPKAPRVRGPQLDTPPSNATFRDRDGKTHSFPDSALKRIAAQLLTERKKKWRYRPFGFPIFSASGSEQEMNFDFYVYDNMDSIFKLILMMPRESREVWDRVGRFKAQYPMYHYELWTPEHLAKIMGPHGTLGW
jgi:hypothetical protein